MKFNITFPKETLTKKNLKKTKQMNLPFCNPKAKALSAKATQVASVRSYSIHSLLEM